MLRRLGSPAVYGVVFMVPISVLVGMHVGGLLTYLTPLLLLVLVPVLDALLGDRGDLEAGEIERLQRNPAFRWILYAWVPVQLGIVVWDEIEEAARETSPTSRAFDEGMKPGDTRVLDFPIVQGFVYPRGQL